MVFVHGGPVPAEARPTPRDWPTLTGYARQVAGQGVVGVTLDHRLHAVTDYEQAAADVADAVERVKMRRSAGRRGPDRSVVLLGRGPDHRGVADGSPGVAALRGRELPDPRAVAGLGLTGSRFHPVRAFSLCLDTFPSSWSGRAGESAEIAATVEEFVAEAARCAANLEIIDVPEGRTGFETLDPTDGAREAVHRAVVCWPA
ncbi:esterase [Streptomyces badius]